MDFLIKSGQSLKGEITVPGDKSISHRSIILSSLAEGKSRISGLLEGEDCLATIEVFRNMGISIVNERGVYFIEGKGLRGLESPEKPLDFGNSGTSIRLCSGILSAQTFKSILVLPFLSAISFMIFSASAILPLHIKNLGLSGMNFMNNRVGK